MTECERIINDGILPESFFKEEVICDFLVTEERKKIWAISLDMLVFFDKICNKHGLRYFTAYGALLGVIRHKGFIPWDDDLDVCMPREDYEKLWQLYRDEFTQPYFLQYPGEDKGYYFSFAKIRNSNTSGISVPFIYEEYNQGISLDIFPLDNCVPDEADINWERINYLNLQQSTNMRRSLLFPSVNDIARMEQYPMRDGHDVLKELNSIATQYNDKETEYCIASTVTAYRAQKLIYRWADVLDTIDCDFYGHKIKIPRNCNRILETTYGDFMQYPPIEKRGLWHANAVFNPDIPYKETLKGLREAALK
jgi:lipopolysaccharide cholinephosphotransferase